MTEKPTPNTEPISLNMKTIQKNLKTSRPYLEKFKFLNVKDKFEINIL